MHHEDHLAQSKTSTLTAEYLCLFIGFNVGGVHCTSCPTKFRSSTHEHKKVSTSTNSRSTSSARKISQAQTYSVQSNHSQTEENGERKRKENGKENGTARTSETSISRLTATLRVRTRCHYLAVLKRWREPWERATAQQHMTPLASPISAMVPGACRTPTLISVLQELLELLIHQQPDWTSQNWIALFTSILE